MNRHLQSQLACLKGADTVAKVEIRTTRKISRKSSFRPLYRCEALYGRYEGRGRFCRKRYGPSRRRARSASAVFKIFVLHPKKTFSTLSARSRHCVKAPVWICQSDDLLARSPNSHKIEFIFLNGNLMVPTGPPTIFNSDGNACGCKQHRWRCDASSVHRAGHRSSC